MLEQVYVGVLTAELLEIFHVIHVYSLVPVSVIALTYRDRSARLHLIVQLRLRMTTLRVVQQLQIATAILVHGLAHAIRIGAQRCKIITVSLKPAGAHSLQVDQCWLLELFARLSVVITTTTYSRILPFAYTGAASSRLLAILCRPASSDAAFA